jgi:hypothetical protein
MSGRVFPSQVAEDELGDDRPDSDLPAVAVPRSQRQTRVQAHTPDRQHRSAKVGVDGLDVAPSSTLLKHRARRLNTIDVVDQRPVSATRERIEGPTWTIRTLDGLVCLVIE